MRFDGFFGNDHVKEQLSAAFDDGRIPHAILLEGPRGSGRRTLAKRIAAACVCSAPYGQRPCGVCPHCVKAADGNHPDIRFFESGGGPRSFSVETVRRIRAEAFVAPNEAARKAFILADIQNMTEAAQNALLKVLEEPPAFLTFLLTCDGKSRVLETVRSRCRLLTLGPLTEDETVRLLAGHFPEMDEAALHRAAQNAGGIAGRAIEGIADEGLETAAGDAEAVAKALCGAREYGLLRLTGPMEKDRARFSALLDLLPRFFADAASSKARGTAFQGCTDAACSLGRRLTLRQLCALTQTSLAARAAADRYANAALLLTWFFCRLWQDAHVLPAG